MLIVAAFAALALTTVQPEGQAAADIFAARVKLEPKPVRDFIDRRINCNHWTGEEPYDKARRREIEKAITELRCATIEADQDRLIKRYPASAAIIREADEQL